MPLSEKNVIAQTQAWIEKAVIGLNLCPFAKAVHIKNQIRYVVSPAESAEALLAEFKIELESLRKVDPKVIDTTLIIHPHVLNIFSDYNEFLSVIGEFPSLLSICGNKNR
jgi:hypothetical protein